MSILTTIWSVCAAANAMLALMHLFLWFRNRSARVYLVSALMALGATGTAMLELALAHTDSIETYARTLAWQNLAVYVLLVPMVWFVYLRFGTARRWLAMAITALWSAAIVANFLSPASLVFAEIHELWHPTAFWGEPFTLARGVENPWVHLANVASLLIVAYLVDASLRVRRRAGGRALFRVGMGMTVFIVAGGIHAPLVDAGIVATPYMVSFAFLAIVLVMTHELVDEAVLASRYAREIVAGQRRWRALLENVHLLVVGLDQDGRITFANPFLARTSGRSVDGLRGLAYETLLPEDDRARFHDNVCAAFAGSPPERIESRILGARGEPRSIVWSTVLLRDAGGAPSEVLAVGADVTEQHAAEQARDAALAETRAALAQVESLRTKLEEQVVYLSSEVEAAGHFDTLIGDSDAMRYVRSRIEQVAPLDTTVLIEGETGVGKELVARSIHAASERAARPLIVVNCAALPPNLVEAELFGHERGAFTGATRRRRGRFELTDGGTLFLDAVGELPLELQGNLLRALQEGEVQPLGAETTVHVDTRVIAATNHPLDQAVAAGRFREDLFYRLSVFPITVPPLRQRKEDLPALVELFVGRLARGQRKSVREIPAAVLDELAAYDWPGNVREVENVLERAVITSPGPSLRLAERLLPTDRSTAAAGAPYPVTQKLAEVERAHILRALEACGWQISGVGGAAARLGLHPNTLRSRMAKHRLARNTASS
jgi:PAS domain S-box-containing protein